jgi:hypothetical protein
MTGETGKLKRETKNCTLHECRPDQRNSCHYYCGWSVKATMEVDNKCDEIKSWAIVGRFEDITRKYGAKKSVKAENYAKVKLDALADKVDKGTALDSVCYATPFMMFALKHKNEKMDAVAKLFSASSCVENDECSQLSDSNSPGSQSKNAPSQTSATTDNQPACEPTERAVVTPLRTPSSAKAKGFKLPSVQHVGVSASKDNSEKKPRDRKKTLPKEKVSGGPKASKEKKSDGPKLVKGGNPAKDPHAPKGAKGSYIFFSAHIRPGKSPLRELKAPAVMAFLKQRSSRKGQA